MIRRCLREPLLHFLWIGFALFVAYGMLNGPDAAGRRDPQTRIELTTDDLRQMGIAWLAQGRAGLGAEQMKSLIDARVREEILYREALALGLDKDDTIVRRRMAQKMEFLFEDVAALAEPTDAQLRAWFEENAESFTKPARVTFRHLYFSPDRRGAHARDDAEEARDALAGKPMDAPEAAGLADRFMFQDYYGDRAPDDVAKSFGPDFARALFGLAPGAWQGPIESGYGWHLVRVDSITPAHVPGFEEVAQDVRTRWTEEQRTRLRDKTFEAMRARYEVVVPDASSWAALADPAVNRIPPLASLASLATE